MTRVSPIQESFAAGEIGERVRGRVSTDAYAKGLALAKNWQPLVQGPIRTREGSQFIEIVDNVNWTSGDISTSGIRVVTFQRGLDQDIVFEIGLTDIIGRDSVTGQQVTNGDSENLIPDPLYAQPIPGTFWTTDLAKYDHNSGTPGTFSVFTPGNPAVNAFFQVVVDGTGDSFAGPALESASGSGAIIIPAGSELLINTLTVRLFPSFTEPLRSTLTYPTTEFSVRIQVGTTPGAGDIIDTTDSILDPDLGLTTLVKNFTPGATNNTLYLSVGVEFTGGGVIPDNGLLQLSIIGHTWTVPLAGGAGTPLEFSSPWTSDQLECLQVCMDPGEQTMVLTHPDVEQQILRFVGPDYTFGPISGEAGFVPPVGSVWSTQDFPAACAFHEGRLWFGGSPSFKSTLWASRSGDYYDYDASAPATKADPLLFPLSSVGNIQTLASRKELVINTDISEVIGTSVQGVIAFDDFSFPKQTDWGSNCVQPIFVGRDMVYTSNSRTRLRTFADEGGTNFGWDGKELSLLAQDIFDSAVRRMVYLDEPAYQACFLLSDGTMGMATYFYPEDVIGWWRYETAYNGQTPTEPGAGNQGPNINQPSNNIMDITKINTSTGAKLWMVINRTGYPGTNRPGHELLSFDSGLVAAMDSYAIRVPNGTLQLTDIDELTDQSCSVVVEQVNPNDGILFYTVHPKVTVIAGTSQPLEVWAEGGTCYIGLAYENEFTLLPREGVSNRGTSQVAKRRWNKVYARLNDSAIPLINGDVPSDRTPITPMGLGEPFITSDTDYIELGSAQGELSITQDKPLRSEVVAIFGKVTSTEV